MGDLVIVPPTDDMVEAGYNEWLNAGCLSGRDVVRAIHAAMLSAAPLVGMGGGGAPTLSGEVREKVARIVANGLAMAEERPDTDPAAAQWLTDAVLSLLSGLSVGGGSLQPASQASVPTEGAEQERIAFCAGYRAGREAEEIDLDQTAEGKWESMR